MALERGSGKFLFLKQKGRTPPVQPIALSRALLTPRPKRAPGKPFLIKEYHKLEPKRSVLCCPNEAAREDQGGVQYGSISGYKNRTPGRRGGSNLIDSTAPPIRSSNYGISRLPEESNPEAVFFGEPFAERT